MLTGDRHFDSIQSNRRLQKKHLEVAVSENAPIIDLGDFFDCMQGRYDPRRTYADLRPEYVGDNYFDLVLDDAQQFFSPYAKQFAVLAYGNHETAVRKHNGIDLTKGLARRLMTTAGDRPFTGGYSGWIIFRFKCANDGMTRSFYMKYHHGYGGGGPVTKGVIQTNRRAVFLPDANIVATSHIHESWVVPIKRERLTQRGVIFQDIAWHINVPTYSNDYGDGSDGFHIEKGRPPKPMGCVWLEFDLQRQAKTDVWSVKAELDIV